MSRFLLSPEAESDLDSIKSYLLERAGPAVTRRVLGKIVAAIHFLADHPRAGHFREELRQSPTRFWSVYPYLVIYDPSMPIEILRVIHAARDISRL